MTIFITIITSNTPIILFLIQFLIHLSNYLEIIRILFEVNLNNSNQ